jgi:hypothetical protein
MAMTTVPPNWFSEQSTRRALLGAMAAAPVVGAMPDAAAAGEDPHLDWWRRHEHLDAARRTVPDDLQHPYFTEMSRLEELIVETPARSLEALAIQSEVLMALIDPEALGEDDLLLRLARTMQAGIGHVAHLTGGRAAA